MYYFLEYIFLETYISNMKHQKHKAQDIILKNILNIYSKKYNPDKIYSDKNVIKKYIPKNIIIINMNHSSHKVV